jgi:hypothetical protein
MDLCARRREFRVYFHIRFYVRVPVLILVHVCVLSSPCPCLCLCLYGAVNYDVKHNNYLVDSQAHTVWCGKSQHLSL